MGNVQIGWAKPLDAALLTASAAIAGLGVNRLKTQDVVDIWNAGASSVWLLADFGQAVDLDGTALIGTNLTASATRRIRVSTSDATGVAGDALDTGTVSAGVDPAFGMVVATFGQRVTGRYLRLDLADAGLTEITAGRWWAGTLFSPAVNIGFGWKRLLLDTTERNETPGGQSHANRRPQRRGFEMTFDFMSDAESAAFAEAMQREIGLWSDALGILNPESPNPGRDTVWGELGGIEDVSNPHFDRYRFLMRIIERK